METFRVAFNGELKDSFDSFKTAKKFALTKGITAEVYAVNQNKTSLDELNCVWHARSDNVLIEDLLNPCFEDAEKLICNKLA